MPSLDVHDGIHPCMGMLYLYWSVGAFIHRRLHVHVTLVVLCVCRRSLFCARSQNPFLHLCLYLTFTLLWALCPSRRGGGVDSSEEGLGFSTRVAEPFLGCGFGRYKKKGARGPARYFVGYIIFHITRQKKMLPAVCVPTFGREGSPSVDYEQQVISWCPVTNLDPANRASLLILRMDIVAREVCTAAGSDAIMDAYGVENILTILQDYFAPEAVRFLQFRWADQTMDEYLAQPDSLRRKAESQMRMGAPFPKKYASALRLQNASLPRSGNSLASASVQRNLGIFAVAQEMMRPLDPRGGGGCGCDLRQ